MPEYIEREALLKDIGETVLFSVRGGAELPTPEMRGANKVIDRIKSAPAADVAEVRHGKWVFDFTLDGSNFYNCSECGRQEVLLAKESTSEYFPYCHCGAKMDGKGEGE